MAPRPPPRPLARGPAPGQGGAELDAVEAGSLLGGRYVLRRHEGEEAGASSWQAHDETLDRPVGILAVATDHPHAAAMLDAARRAAGVEDPRLVRVLDAGRDQELAYVVTEWVAGPTLRQLLREGSVPAEDVRTMVGEAALALENARRRGLHHLALTPDDVHLLNDDTVKLAGLEVHAALTGRDLGPSQDAEAACAFDTRTLVALAYAGLTGFWPLAEPECDLPAAPEVAGSPAAPSEVVGAVPADLDTLCVQTFAGAGAPSSPGDLAGQIAPWGRGSRAPRRQGAFPLSLQPARASGRADAGGRRAPGGNEGTAVLPPGPPARARTPTPRPPAATPPRASEHTQDTTQVVRPVLGTALRTDLFDGDRARPAPLLPMAPIGRPQTRQIRTVIVVVVAFIAIFFLLAYCGLSGLGSGSLTNVPRRSASTTPASSGSPSSAPSTPAESPTAAGRPIPVVSITGFDPQGDGSEKNALAPLAIDGNASTAWTSETYRTAQFGGLKKGVGLLLDLGKPTPVNRVAVIVGASGSALELRTATGNTLAGSTVVAQASNASGTVHLTPTRAVTTRYLVLWFTAAAPSNGGYRVSVNEVSVS